MVSSLRTSLAACLFFSYYFYAIILQTLNQQPPLHRCLQKF